MKKSAFLFSLLAVSMQLMAQNPYLPLWEYIPDGEPYVFEDPDCPGKYRVYVYGSHDNLITEYCGRDQVVWSAPVEDLTAWRYDGIIFISNTNADGQYMQQGGRGDVLYAPDIAVKKNADGKTLYYLYPNNQEGGRQTQVAVSDRPDGPFKVCNWSKDRANATDGILGFDPAVFVDDDGRVYGYWGFNNSNGAELDPETMASVKPGTEIVTDMISGCKQPGDFRFFEASSIRKIEDKYVFIYSRTTADGEFGLPAVNYTLAYAYSDNPLGPFKYGGTLIDARARGTDADGNVIATANPYGNTHGSICCINGQWWVFYHRQTGTDEYSRQAMVAPIKVKVEKGKGGKVEISEGEYTSEGFSIQGLNPLYRTPAGLACYYINPEGIGQKYPNFLFTGSYIKATRIDWKTPAASYSLKEPFCPVINNTSGSVVGYKYLNFDKTAKMKSVSLKAEILPQGVDGTITVLAGGPALSRGGKQIAQFRLSSDMPQQLTEMKAECSGMSKIKGKQPLFFVFESDTKAKSICELSWFQFE